MQTITQEQKERYNAARRRKYRNDPEYRAKELARKAAKYTPHPIERKRDKQGKFTKGNENENKIYL